MEDAGEVVSGGLCVVASGENGETLHRLEAALMGPLDPSVHGLRLLMLLVSSSALRCRWRPRSRCRMVSSRIFHMDMR